MATGNFLTTLARSIARSLALDVAEFDLVLLALAPAHRADTLFLVDRAGNADLLFDLREMGERNAKKVVLWGERDCGALRTPRASDAQLFFPTFS